VAANQLVNHLDKISHLSHGKLRPKVIIKTMVGSVRPLHAGVQHSSDFTAAFKQLLTEDVVIEDLTEPEMIYPAYKQALEREDGKSTLLVEYGDYYNEK
jgi:pyruvate/2-oxoglutarate/acetoin dehydrogenase E1 component